MNKYKLSGLILAVILLAAAIVCKLVFSDAGSAKISLPLLAAGLWAITIFDALAYRTTEATGINKKLELSRLIGGALVTLLVTAAIVVMLASGTN